MAGAKSALAAIAVLFLCQPAFSLWVQQLYVQAADLEGNPVERALVEVRFQNASAVSESDGSISGYTEPNGFFLANLSNIVPKDYEIRTFKVRVSTPYWEGEEKSGFANGTYTLLNFTVPVRLEKVVIWVVNSSNFGVENASVFLQDYGMLKRTGKRGTALFLLPSGLQFSGYAAHGNLSKSFSSDELRKGADGDFIKVQLPQAPLPSWQSKSGSGIVLRAVFFGQKGEILAGQAVRIFLEGNNSTVLTDESGAVEVRIPKAGAVLRLVAERNEYPYSFEFAVNKSAEERLTLGNLLKINSFTAKPESQNCYVLLANITDPRLHLPLDVRMSRHGPAAEAPLEVSLTPQGLFMGRICISSDTQVRLVAKNKYETAEEVVALAFVRPQPAKPASQAGNASWAQQGEKRESGFGGKEAGEAILSVLALGIVVAFLSVFIFGRRYLGRAIRFISEYLRQIFQRLEKKKPVPPPVQPPA
ncbi:MAG: hypothetical protein N3E51_03450 [Candidatus Micrarchaeota archaeon]|nr:hypothetical protein [Candidatus Micrarchaeota archaeon]